MIVKKDFKKILSLTLPAIVALAICIPKGASASTTYTCDTTDEIQYALKNAVAGDTIYIEPGTYTGVASSSASGSSDAYFYSNKSGTSSNPITIKSSDTSNPAVLQGSSTSSDYVLYLTGDYWVVDSLKIKTGKKGIMIDNGNYNIIQKCTVTNIGEEGVHFRDGSSYNNIRYCTITNTGLTDARYGEGIYVGSDKLKWVANGGDYNPSCDYNTIKSNTIGSGVAAESIDLKEGTTGTKIYSNTFNGTGISGENYADSFIDVKGNDSKIYSNTFNRNSNSIIVDGIQVHEIVSGWGYDNYIYDNTFNLDTSTPYVVNVVSGSAYVSNNTRSPSGNMYTGDYTEY